MRASARNPVAAMTKPAFATPRSHPDENRGSVSGPQIAVAGKRPKREEFRIAVIAQIKNTREAGCGEARLVPEAVLTLSFQEVVDAFGDQRMVHLAGCHQAKQRPGG